MGKLLKQIYRPAKLFYSFSSQWRKNPGELKILSTHKAKVPVCLWLELSTIVCWGASLRAVIRGVTMEARGTISRAQNHYKGSAQAFRSRQNGAVTRMSSGRYAKLHTVTASNNRDQTTRSLYYCLFAPHICGCCSSRTSRSWWITHSTQRHRRGCNITFRQTWHTSSTRLQLSIQTDDNVRGYIKLTIRWKNGKSCKSREHTSSARSAGFGDSYNASNSSLDRLDSHCQSSFLWRFAGTFVRRNKY